MAELVLFHFGDSETARAARAVLLQAARDGEIELAQAVVARRDVGGKLQLGQGLSPWPATLFQGAIWGLVIGFVMMRPLPGLLIGAGIGFGAGGLAAFGLRRAMRRAAGLLRPGETALLILARAGRRAELRDQIAGLGGVIGPDASGLARAPAARVEPGRQPS